MWLLVVALTFSGWAAASMLTCGPGHHQIAASAAPVDLAPDVDNGLPDGTFVSLGEAVHDHGASAHDEPHKLAKVKCSVCAACCTGAALPSSTVTFEATPAINSAVPELPTTAALFQTGGPERPPRAISS